MSKLKSGNLRSTYRQELKLFIMKEMKLYGCTLEEIGSTELQFVRGGASVALLENFWESVKKVLDFIMEYQQEMVEGFKRGWNNF